MTISQFLLMLLGLVISHCAVYYLGRLSIRTDERFRLERADAVNNAFDEGVNHGVEFYRQRERKAALDAALGIAARCGVQSWAIEEFREELQRELTKLEAQLSDMREIMKK